MSTRLVGVLRQFLHGNSFCTACRKNDRSCLAFRLMPARPSHESRWTKRFPGDNFPSRKAVFSWSAGFWDAFGVSLVRSCARRMRALVCVTRRLCERVNICGQSGRYQGFVRPVRLSSALSLFRSLSVSGSHGKQSNRPSGTFGTSGPKNQTESSIKSRSDNLHRYYKLYTINSVSVWLITRRV